MLKKLSRSEKPHFSWINRPITQKDSDFLEKSFKKRRRSPFSKILNRFINKSTLEAKMPKLQFTNNLKLQSLEKEIEKEKEKEKNLTQRKKDIPQMINNNDNLYNLNSGDNLEKEQINKKKVFENENIKKNNMKIISKRLEIKQKNEIFRNQYNQMFNIYHKKFINTSQINTVKNRAHIIDNGLYSPSNIKINDISDYQIPYNPSKGNNKNINYNFVITPYIANKTINIYSNNLSQINSSSSQQKIIPQNKLKKIIISKHNSSNNINKIIPKNSFPFNRNVNTMKIGFTDYKNSEKKNTKSIFRNVNSYFEQNITYKRKFWK
jgi:hypothetical protein